MKVFISHSSANKEFALGLKALIESVIDAINPSEEKDIFCSSEEGSIPVGTRYIEFIFSHLNNCDIFIPILSPEFFESKFCMIELGTAYSLLGSSHKDLMDDYILPFVLPPTKPGESLDGTPLQCLQIGSIDSKEDLKSIFRKYNYETINKNNTIITSKINNYLNDITTEITERMNFISTAEVNTFFDDSIAYHDKKDVASCRIGSDGNDSFVDVNFNMRPLGDKSIVSPSFISLVLHYVDLLNLKKYLKLKGRASFCVSIDNSTGSLSEIDIEFKYSPMNEILKKYTFPLKRGANDIKIELKEMGSNNALAAIKQICFVIHESGVIDKSYNGSFVLRNVHIETD